MVGDFLEGGGVGEAGVPGAEGGVVEPGTFRRGVEEGGHDDTGIGAAHHPLITGQAVEAVANEAVRVGPAGRPCGRGGGGGL